MQHSHQNDSCSLRSGGSDQEILFAGYNERYHRGETSHTIHVWWARRPHSAMRSLVFSSVCKDKSESPHRIIALFY
ncbi:MAG: DUF1156 domain-containing protein [Solobacterium sp.]|nr:DUF1156 domain-containing protein [Solobacterium sp.]